MSHRRTCVAVFSLSIVFALAVLLSLCSCQNVGYAEGERTAKEAFELRAMTFNIRYGTADDGENRWENRREFVVNILRDSKPDVVGLQEALDFQLAQIREGIVGYGQLGVAREDGKTKGEYCAILYRRDLLDVNESGTFWFSDTPDVPGSSHWGNANVRICTWARFIEKKSGRAFYHYNLHLDHVSQPSREKSVVLLTKHIHERKHLDLFIITGDFNAGEGNSAITYLTGKTTLVSGGESKSGSSVPVVDTFRVLHSDAVEVGTFHAYEGNRKGEKIDFIFTLPDVQVIEAEIVHTQYDGRYPSDHFPVTTRLRLRPVPAK